MDDQLLRFIRDELQQTVLAEKLSAWKKNSEEPDELLIMILQECSYCTTAEIQSFRQKLLSYRKMGKAEWIKERADLYFSLKQYKAAIHHYEKILEDWRLKSFSNEFTAAIWNNIGASYAGIFWFDKAMAAYDMSYKFKKSEDTLKRMYQLTLFYPELRLRERYQALMSEEQKTDWKKEFEEIMAQSGRTEQMAELSRLFEGGMKERESGTEKLLKRWKKEYRMMLQ